MFKKQIKINDQGDFVNDCFSSKFTHVCKVVWAEPLKLNDDSEILLQKQNPADEFECSKEPETRASRRDTAVASTVPDTSNDTVLWTVREAATFLRISERKLWYGLRTPENEAGSIPHVRFGKMPRFVPDDLKRWAAEGFPPAATFKEWKKSDDRRRNRGG